MRFASTGRWAKCRAANLSPWSRRLNAQLHMHRSLCAAPILRLAAEPRPPEGFVEQRNFAVGSICSSLSEGQESDDDSHSELVAAIINGVMELDVSFSTGVW
eukprot:CAMPEP_0172671604 /NCGR_PEP_ID=MMETSP1074-20121228/11023_1 /TAXON_ID=2916 /ORGANISM="Ceratium fusus, Strain PA161109" /LENGTH=101 /DNA_ID=CAMNT_0013488679 /DNA_START=48 /DNA_END=350 /DNA_ORIENTATION=+